MPSNYRKTTTGITTWLNGAFVQLPYWEPSQLVIEDNLKRIIAANFSAAIAQQMALDGESFTGDTFSEDAILIGEDVVDSNLRAIYIYLSNCVQEYGGNNKLDTNYQLTIKIYAGSGDDNQPHRRRAVYGRAMVGFLKSFPDKEKSELVYGWPANESGNIDRQPSIEFNNPIRLETDAINGNGLPIALITTTLKMTPKQFNYTP